MMRVGGIVSGMDIEGMVKKLMEAERSPLVRLQQQQTTLEWKRDSFREINNKLLDLDKMMLDMKLTTTYNPKSVTSSNDKALTATANSSVANGTYNINVSQLATGEMHVGGAIQGDFTVGEHEFFTYDDKGEKVSHKFEVKAGDSVKDILKSMEKASDGKVRAFVDTSANRVVLETTRTGKYNTAGNGKEIEFASESAGLFNQLGLTNATVTEAQNAKFTYNNGLEIVSKDNNYNFNGLNLQFHNVTEGNVRLSVNTDVDQSFDKIMNFVNKYNETIEAMNKSQTEEKYRQFQPLTEEQKEEMSENEIKLWEEKAKSGILRGESAIRDGMAALRGSVTSLTNNDGAYKMLSQIGITTTKNYLDGGKLEVDEEKLKAALRDNPDDVYKLFVNNSKGEDRGIINKFDDALDQTRAKIERRAGKSTQTLDNYEIGKRMKDLNERIDIFQKKLVTIEQRYWNQFTQMEKAISNLNQQSANLFSQFGQM